MPFALLLFELYRRLLILPAEKNRAACVALLSCGLLLRAESMPWLFGLVALAWIVARKDADSERLRLARGCAICLCVGAVVLGGARLLYFGQLLPNTAFAKVALSQQQWMRGVGYIARFFIVFPATAIALSWIAFTLARARWRDRSSPVLGALLCISVSVAFCVAIGGDFMTMFRFAVPTLAFVGLLLAFCVERREASGDSRGKIAAYFAGGLCLANVLAAFGIEPLRREIFAHAPHMGRQDLQLGVLKWQRHDSQVWSDLGRVLELVAPHGASLVARGIGAVSYYSTLTIFDRHGMVSSEVAHSGADRTTAAAGHDLYVPIAFFEPRRPTYAYAGLHTEEELEHPGPEIFKRIFGHPDDSKTQLQYRPVVFRAAWLPRAEHFLLLAERIEPDSTVIPDWSGSLMEKGACRDLPEPAPRNK